MRHFEGGLTLDEYSFRIDDMIEDQPVMTLSFHDPIKREEKIRLGNDLLSNLKGGSPFKFFCLGAIVATLINTAIGGLIWWLLL
jgi:hypothetical protein